MIIWMLVVAARERQQRRPNFPLLSTLVSLEKVGTAAFFCVPAVNKVSQMNRRVRKPTVYTFNLVASAIPLLSETEGLSFLFFFCFFFQNAKQDLSNLELN